jgi:hypothetical protein
MYGKAYIKNVPGPFYVEDGCCISCQVPESEAPELISSDKESCFIQKQPETELELEHMLNAIGVSCVDCTRYRGTDQGILKRLAKMGKLDQADYPEGEE